MAVPDIGLGVAAPPRLAHRRAEVGAVLEREGPSGASPTETVSPIPSIARPGTSNPGPTLPIEPGAKAATLAP
ncbi:MAG TPA: hypothetical protein VGS57_23325 [Thermoanaerobaculia bacterium]|nr:hypothetical protein [Thermoanaerobaculia bacterium]